MATILKTYNSMGIPMNIQRGEPIPLDKTELYYSYEDAVAYAKSATAYVGQTIKVIDEASGKITWYIIGPDTENPLINKDAEVNTKIDAKLNASIDSGSIKDIKDELNAEIANIKDALKSYVKSLIGTGSIISYLDGEGNELGSFNTTFVGTRAEYNAAYEAKKIPVGTIVVITDEEDDELAGDAASPILGVGVLGHLILG